MLIHGLSTIRDTWLECYKNGDVDCLMKYESGYEKIQYSLENGSWFQPEMKTVVIYKKKSNKVEVVGYCKILSGKRLGLKLEIQELGVRVMIFGH